MIVKNEAGNLPDCLDSAKEQVDEIVIIDTGSSDTTPEIARRYTTKVYSYPWADDFSLPRNFGISQASGDWILVLDADEELVNVGTDLKHVLAGDPLIEAYLLPLENQTTSGTGEGSRFCVLRLFKNNGLYRYVGQIHEQVAVSSNGVVGVTAEVSILHKMLPAKERNRKRGRNLVLLTRALAAEPRNHFLSYYLGVEWLMLGQPARALLHLQKAYANLPDDQLLFLAPALRYLLICLKDLGRFDEGICLALEAAEKYPEYSDIYYFGGVLLEEKQEYSPAVRWFTQAIQAGIPPALYSHLSGAGDFLAYYHLGYCSEKLGQAEEAQQAYEAALTANPNYVYPLYNLLLILLQRQGAYGAFNSLVAKGYLRTGEFSLALPAADFFSKAGYPQLAYRCLEYGTAKTGIHGKNADRANSAEKLSLDLGRYAIFSGRIREGLTQLETIPEMSACFIESKLYYILGLLLLGQFPPARTSTLELWRKPEGRCQAYLLLSLNKLMEKDRKSNYQEKIRETSLLQAALNLWDPCSRYWPDPEQDTLISRMVESLETVITGISADGKARLLNLYKEKTQTLESLACSRFGSLKIPKE